MNPSIETTVRNAWADRLWKRKGYDSPDEFKEHSYCFACGMTGVLQARSVTADSATTNADDVHLLCNHCHTDSRDLNGFSYLRWFLNQSATKTIAAHMLVKMGKLCGQSVYTGTR